MMKADIICFTERGLILAERIKKSFGEGIEVYYKFRLEGREIPETVKLVREPLTEWAAERFNNGTALIFIGACGIAVRSIAPSVRDKMKDIPVVVMDEAGRHVIPILSAHYGGGSELAAEISSIVGGETIITTATDLNELFAADVFARKNNLAISSKEGVKKVSAKILRGDEISFRIEGGKFLSKLPKEVKNIKKGNSDILISPYRDNPVAGHSLKLVPRVVYAGIGCMKDKPMEEIAELFDRTLSELNIDSSAIHGVATIDLKANEKGLREFVRDRNYSFQSFSADVLKKLRGNFTASAFVAKTVGIDNVCERACMAAAGKGASLICKKKAWNGVTVAFAISKWSVFF
ncbi:cobalt-precorrin 5A hydrolase [Lachnospiraceae bacterium C1.1]|nr:cobalamin biosynthesis protein [Lachnospiraceae bacterium C1.1]